MAQEHALLCQEIEGEFRELCAECKKKFPVIREYTEKAILKVRTYREHALQRPDGNLEGLEFPLDEVLRSILMACETFQNRIVLISLSCLQRLIHRRVLKDQTIAIVINLMKEQATGGDENVQLKVLQTIMATPSHMMLLNELVVEQLLQLLFVLHTSNSPSVHHTACASLRQLAEYLADQAATSSNSAELSVLSQVTPAVRRAPGNQGFTMPLVAASQPPQTLEPAIVRTFFLFVQDLCVMADYDSSSSSNRYAVDAGERMRRGSREGFWLLSIRLPRPLCLELLGACVSSHPEVFRSSPETFGLLRQGLCAVLLKNLRCCFDFPVMVRCIHLLQLILKSEGLGELLVPELQVFLQVMLDLTIAERSTWQRATSLEFLKSVCEDSVLLPLLYAPGTTSGTSLGTRDEPGSRPFVELVNSLGRMMHQVCFASGLDSGALLQVNAQGPTDPTGGGKNTPSSADTRKRSSSGGTAGKCRLLQLMSEAEPPPVAPAMMASLVVECLFSVVFTMYRLLLDASGQEGGATPAYTNTQNRRSISSLDVTAQPLGQDLSAAQLQVQGMLAQSWGVLLSALSLLLHGTADEAFLQHALKCMQTLLYCCGRLNLAQARDACLLQLSRYALPGVGHEAGADELTTTSNVGAVASLGLTQKNSLCFKALLNICHCFGGLLGVPGWTTALRTFDGLERVLQKAQQAQLGSPQELMVLQQSLESLFESTAVLPNEALADIIQAMGEHAQALMAVEESSDAFDKTPRVFVLNRLVELCTFNLSRLLVVWNSVLKVILDMCTCERRKDLRGLAAAALCRVLAEALKKGRLEVAEQPELVQDELLKPLQSLLCIPHEDVRLKVCEGLLSILQASGQELRPAAWGTVIQLVATAAQVDLERAGVEFFLHTELDAFSPGESSKVQGSEGVAARDSPVLAVVFQLLELLVQDFMEYIPPRSVPQLTASIGAFARFTGLGVNSSLTAVGFLWNIADALARYHCSPSAEDVPVPAATQVSSAPESQSNGVAFDELWIQIFTHLRIISVDPRPEVRNCAVKSLTSALLSHGRKVGAGCYRRCVQDILLRTLVEVRVATERAQEDNGTASSGSRSLIVHHSRNTLQKQWDETLVLGTEGVRRVLSHFAEEVGVATFAPLAYSLLLQIQTTIAARSPEVSGASARALADLMRIPPSARVFAAATITEASDDLPVPAGSEVSVWSLGWNVLWRTGQLFLKEEVPEGLMEAVVSTLTAIRTSHSQKMTPSQHLILVYLTCVMATSPSFYLPCVAPLLLDGAKISNSSNSDLLDSSSPLSKALGNPETLTALYLAEAGISSFAPAPRVPTPTSGSGEEADDRAIISVVPRCAGELWDTAARTSKKVKEPYKKSPKPLEAFVTRGTNPCLTAKSLEFLLRPNGTEETNRDPLGQGNSPNHRGMLHTCSAKLAHTQGIIFAVFEETPQFQEAFLNVLFLQLVCDAFLDPKIVFQDVNKVALAARALVVLLLFWRKVLFSALGTLNGGDASARRHIEMLIGMMPFLCQRLGALSATRCDTVLSIVGLWRLAGETLLYLSEDSLQALERVPDLCPSIVDPYWKCLPTALAGAALEPSLPIVSPEQSPEPALESELLDKALGNLIAHRVLSCVVAPREVLRKMFEILDGFGRAPNGSRRPDLSRDGLGHLFRLCSTLFGTSSEGPAVLEESIAALTARGGTSSEVEEKRSGTLQAKRPDSAALLQVAVPALVGRVQSVLSAFAYDEARCDGAMPQHRIDEVCFVLSRLKNLDLDGASFTGTLSVSSAKAKEVCALAGSRCCAMALLPQLIPLVSSRDANVRATLQEVLQCLTTALDLSS